jgi:hypothetical protein
MAGYAASQLQQHASRSFEDSERLFREAAPRAGDADSPTHRYLTAAHAYARSLESAVGWRGGMGVGGAGEARSGGATDGFDPQTTCLINHGVKEVLDACKLKKMCRMMGQDAEGTDVLRQHAQQMQNEGRQLIDRLASTGQGASGTAGASGPLGSAARGSRTAPAGTGDNLLDAATARTRDRDVTTASGTQTGSTSGRGGTGTTGTGTTGAGTTGYTGGGPGAGGSNRSGTGADRTGFGVGSGPTGTLAMQARDLVQIIDQLSGE